jgi:O-antigen ligase
MGMSMAVEPPATSVPRIPSRTEGYGPLGRAFIALAIAIFSAFALSGQPGEACLAVTALCLVTFGITKPDLLMVALFGLMPFSNAILDNVGLNISGTDAIAAFLTLTLPFHLLRLGRFRAGMAALPVAVFLLVCTTASITHAITADAVVSVLRMAFATISGILIFANIDTSIRTYRRCLNMYLLATIVLACFSVLTFVRFGIGASMYTLDINKNALGPTFGVGTIIALNMLINETRARRRRFLVLCLVASVVGNMLCLSRGGWTATGFSCLLLLLLTRRFKLLIVSSMALCVIVAVVWSVIPEDAREYASDVGTGAHTVQTRFEVMRTVLGAFKESPLMGVGVGLRKYAEPHNVVVLTLGETGIFGLAAFLWMFGAAFYSFWAVGRELKRSSEAAMLLRIGACVLLLTFADGLMDVYWRRGCGFAGWAAVGMAAGISAHRYARKRNSKEAAAPQRSVNV